MTFLVLLWLIIIVRIVLIDTIALFSAYILDNFIVGVTNTSSDVSPPIRASYVLCGQYPTTAAPGQRLIQYCGTTTPPGRYVIIQQPADGTGFLAICELEVYVKSER